LIWSDGCLANNSISIKSKDRDLLEQAELILKGRDLIVQSKNKKYWNLRFSDKNISKRLRKMGLTEAKSLIIGWPVNLPKKFQWHFIRGVFDGDGCATLSHPNVSNNTPRIALSICSGSKEFAEKLYRFLLREKLNAHIYQSSITNVWNVGVSSIDNCKNFIHYIYNNAQHYLARKHAICMHWLSIKRPPLGRIPGTPNISKFSAIEQQIIDDYLTINKTSEKTGLKFGISSTSVLSILKRNNIKRYSGRCIFARLPDDIKISIITDRRNGMTFKELFNKYHLGRETIRKTLRESFHPILVKPM